MEKFIELSEYSKSNRSNIINISDYKNIRRDYEAYVSLYTYSKDVIDYIDASKDKSIRFYNGECFSNFLWIDVDIKGELELATNSMLELVDRLQTVYNITYKSLMVYFSGQKGYHVGIPSKSFGAEEYWSTELPSIHKKMASKLGTRIRGIDYVIYNTTRLFRVPNSKHPETGRYKIPVDVERIKKEGIEPMLECSDFCNKHSSSGIVIEYSDKLRALFEECSDTARSEASAFGSSSEEETEITLFNNTSIFRLPANGERNDLIYKMAYRLFAVDGLKRNEVADMMKFIYEVVNNYSVKMKWPRYSEMELKISVDSAYRRTRVKPIKKVGAVSIASKLSAMFESIKHAQYVSTIVGEIDDDLGGGWKRGDLYSFIGKSGTMKSFVLLECIMRAVSNNEPSLFVNLEMSEQTCFDRIFKHLFTYSLTEMIKGKNITEANIALFEENMQERLRDNLYIYNGVDTEPEELTKIINDKKEEVKKDIKITGIDSVSGMKLYNDSEAMTALKLSKGVKETAKATGTAIILINHANSSCPYLARDCSAFVRGGQKFVDNCDAYLSFSHVVDKEKSNFVSEDIQYLKGIKYMRFYNKRGSGNTINKIIQYQENSGKVIVLDKSVSEYEVDTGVQNSSYRPF